MIINEKGLVRNIKYAYKREGYCIIGTREQITLFTDGWYIRADWDKFPRKALAAIVECMGTLPTTPDALAILAGEEPQVVMPEVVAKEVEAWETGEKAAEAVTMVPMMYQGYQLYQAPDGGPCYGVQARTLSMVERDIAEWKDAHTMDENRLHWSHDGELVILGAIRPTASYWTRDWERTIWSAMESVDLHSRPD